MKPRTIGIIAAIAILTNILWIVLLVLMESDAPGFGTVVERINFIGSKSTLYRICYLNAALLTFVYIVFMTSLYSYSKKVNELWANIAFVFVPIYGLLNIFSYLSQVIIIPPLLDLYYIEESNAIATTLLDLFLHAWPGSIIESLNGLAYAILGIPSIIFALLIMRKPKVLAIGGILLALSGLFSIAAFSGTLIFTKYFGTISVIGGVLATLANFPIAYHFLFNNADDRKKT